MKLNIVILDISSTRTHSTITNQYQSSTTIITFKTFFFYFFGRFFLNFVFLFLLNYRPTDGGTIPRRTNNDGYGLAWSSCVAVFFCAISFARYFSFCFFNFMYACTLDWIFTGSSRQGSNFLEETQHLSFAIAKDYFLTFLHV